MKSIFDMSGTERAAALLVALGPRIAADIMKHLDDVSIDKISLEIARIDSYQPEEREDLIGEFIIDLRKAKRRIDGGEDRARDLLQKAFGDDKADEVLRKVSTWDAQKEFDEFENQTYKKEPNLILVAEDEQVNFLFIEAIFRKIDLPVRLVHAMNGLEAVEYIKNNSVPDLVLMDIKMPELNGHEATRIMKAIHPDLIIVNVPIGMEKSLEEL